MLNRIKLLVITLFALPIVALAVFNNNQVIVLASSADEDAAVTYKAKCAMCHGQKAEKSFDAALTDEQLVEIILKGEKKDKPPAMPGYEAKGMTKEQAQALVTHMRKLREPETK